MGKLAEEKGKKELKQVLFERHIAIFNILDPARLFEAKIGRSEKFDLTFESERNDGQFEV